MTKTPKKIVKTTVRNNNKNNIRENDPFSEFYEDSDSDFFSEFTEQLEDINDLTESEIRRIALWGTDWTIETILRQLEKGNINLNPGFQRRDAWRSQGKSEFIESAILQLPIPQIILAESREKEKRGTFIVIDGKQRLLTLAQFASGLSEYKNDNFQRFGNLSILKSLNGISFEKFHSEKEYASYKNNFENCSIRTIIIRNWENENFLYQVFLRTNTGSVKLSPQELRQALIPGQFSKWIDERAGSSRALKDILRKDEPDFRMRDIELMLRFLALSDYLREYDGNLKRFLDNSARKFNSNFDVKFLNNKAEQLEAAHEKTKLIFADRAYKKWNADGYERRFNRAVFDCQMYVFKNGSLTIEIIKKNAQKLEGAFKNLCVDNLDFRNSIERSTKTPLSLVTRLSEWSKAVSKITGIKLKLPKLEGDNAISEGVT